MILTIILTTEAESTAIMPTDRPCSALKGELTAGVQFCVQGKGRDLPSTPLFKKDKGEYL